MLSVKMITFIVIATAGISAYTVIVWCIAFATGAFVFAPENKSGYPLMGLSSQRDFYLPPAIGKHFSPPKDRTLSSALNRVPTQSKEKVKLNMKHYAL